MKETVFVTGGLGFIGSYTCRLLLEKNYRVVVYDLFKSFVAPLTSTHQSDNLQARRKWLQGKIKVIEGDIRDAQKLRQSILTTKPKRVIHFAGLPIADVSDQFPDEAISINFQGTVNLLQAISELKPKLKRLVNISSSMVYGNFQYTPADENHPTIPKGIYGITKLGAEHLTRVYSERHGFDYITLRPSAVYGPTDSNQRVVQLFIEAAMASKPIILHENGAAKLDFTYVEDLAAGVVLAATKIGVRNETFNMTYGQGRSLKELALIIKKYFPKTKLVYKQLPENQRRPKRGSMDITKAKKLLGYRPQYSLEKGVAKYLKFLQQI